MKELIINGITYRAVEEKIKEPVKPKEWWICSKYGANYTAFDNASFAFVYNETESRGKIIHVREVLPSDPQLVLVTRAMLANAWDEIIVHYCSSWKAKDSSYFKMFCKSLGFGDE